MNLRAHKGFVKSVCVLCAVAFHANAIAGWWDDVKQNASAKWEETQRVTSAKWEETKRVTSAKWKETQRDARGSDPCDTVDMIRSMPACGQGRRLSVE